MTPAPALADPLAPVRAAMATTLAAVTAAVDAANKVAKDNYLQHTWNDWTLPILEGRPQPLDPPKPPLGWTVGFFDDPTTGPANPQSPFGNAVVQWAYAVQNGGLVCAMPPIPPTLKPPAPAPLRTDILPVPIGDTVPVGHTITAPNGDTYQKQSSPTPWGIAFWYQKVMVSVVTP